MTRKEALQMEWVEKLCKESSEDMPEILALAASNWTEEQIRDWIDTYGSNA